MPPLPGRSVIVWLSAGVTVMEQMAGTFKVKSMPPVVSAEASGAERSRPDAIVRLRAATKRSDEKNDFLYFRDLDS